MSLAMVTNLTAAAFGVIGLWALSAPAAWRAAIKAFPRFAPAGWILAAIDLVWFAINIQHTPLGGLDQYKVALWVVTPVVIFLIVRFMDELLAVRALGGILLLAPGVMLDASRLNYETPYRLIIVAVAYVLIVAGCFLVSGPHRFRQWLSSPSSSDRLARVTGLSFAVLAGALAALANTAYAAIPPAP